MKRFLKLLPCIALAVLLVCIALHPIEAHAASVEDLTFRTVTGGYAVADCNADASGELIIPSTYEGLPVTEISQQAFQSCKNLTSITIPNSVTKIGFLAFNSCESLTSITIPNSVTKIDDVAFPSCHSLTGIWVDKDNPNYCSDSYGVLFNKDKTKLLTAPPAICGSYIIPDSVSELGSDAFVGCDRLTSVTIPRNVTSIGYTAFNNCTSLTSIQVDENNSNYCDINGVLFNKDKTTLVFAPGGISGHYTVPAGVTRINAYAFVNCPKLTGITLADSVKDIDLFAVSSADKNTYDNGRYLGTASNPYYALVSSNKSATEIIIHPDAKIIAAGVFYDGFGYGEDYALISISIPAGLKYIAIGAFKDAGNLEKVYYGGTKEQWETIEIADGNYDLTQAKIIFNSYDVTLATIPTTQPTVKPTEATTAPTQAPTTKPTEATIAPTQAPTTKPTETPTTKPTVKPTTTPTVKPTTVPTAPSTKATVAPTVKPTVKPTIKPTSLPTTVPTTAPTVLPTEVPATAPLTKVEIISGGITEVPAALEQAGIETPEQVKDAIVKALTEKANSIDKENIAHYDIALQYTPDNGETWVNADSSHFPEDGKLTVTLPYPAGTDETYSFIVAHMFTNSAFGKTPGDVELPEVTNTAEGIQFEVTGLSPISVGWTTSAEMPATEPTTSPTETSKTQTTLASIAATEPADIQDNSNNRTGLIIAIVVVVALAGGAIAFVIIKKKKA